MRAAPPQQTESGHAQDAGRLRTWLLAALIALVLLRSAVFVLYRHSHFDSDQAVFGIMAKDIVAGRAFPLFMYGRRYLLGVGSWLCAPLFALFGASVFTLKLPMVAMNVGCAALLFRMLAATPAVGPWGAALATLPFAVPSVITASQMTAQCGGNIEPLFFCLLAYALRARPIALGLVFGIAFLNREFALIGFIALLLLDAATGELKARARQRGLSALVILAVVIVIRSLAEWTQGYYGDSIDNVGLQNVFEGAGFSALFGLQIPTLLGCGDRVLAAFNVTSALHTGHAWLYPAVALWLALGVAGAVHLRRSTLRELPAYLVLLGAGQAAAFVLLCTVPRDIMLVRYVLLSQFLWVAAAAIAWSRPRLRAPIAALVFLVVASNAWDHLHLAHEYLAGPPHDDHELLADELLARNIRYVTAEFWVAYNISFLTDERVIASPPLGAMDSIARYRSEVARHRKESVRITTYPCGPRVFRWYLCREGD